MSLFILIVQYLLLAFIVIYATSKLSYYVDELDKKTNISGALIGGVLLATITSMPEFITSITSTMSLGEPALAFGNVFGSNIFNITILAVADIIFIKHMFFNKVKSQRKTNGLVILMYAVFMVPLLLGTFTNIDFDSFTFPFLLTFNIISIIIVVIYALSIKAMNDDEVEEDDSISNMSREELKQMIQDIVLDTMDEEEELHEIIENLTKNY